MSATALSSRPKGVIEGYVERPPTVVRESQVATIDCASIYYRQVNEAIRAEIAAGIKTIRLTGVNGQRYIGNGLKARDVSIIIEGTPGQDLAMFMDGPTIDVRGNAQDGVCNTMNSGTVVVRGDAGDVLGYGMRGGRLFVAGDVGYRVGIHMKAYEGQRPVMVCGGRARDFFGEYMAGGLLVLLGMNSRLEGPLVGGYVGTGMHGGEILLRGEVEPWQCGKEVGVFDASESDMAALQPVLADYCAAVGMDLDEVMAAPFTRIVPVSHRPYGKLYTYL